MARYEKPPDPRQSGLRTRRTRRQRDGDREPLPWVWLLLGTLVTMAAIAFSLALVNRMLSRPPLTVSLVGATPTIIRLTAPPTRVPTLTPVQPTLTPIPTLTPFPTPDLSVAPVEITVGYYARVTPDIGVTVRGGPSTQNVALFVADFDQLVLVIGGPTQGSDFEWWEVQLEDGTEGWVAGDFIEPVAAP